MPGAYDALAASKPNKKPYFVLDPEWGSHARCNVSEGRKSGSCHGCKACHAHAKNKLFASRGAAQRHRAHKGCKCKVVQGGTFDPKTWEDLFGGPGQRRAVVDKRSKQAKAAFRRRARRRARRRRNR